MGPVVVQCGCMFVPLTPLRCLHRAMDLFGRRVGVVCGGREFTYAEFGSRCQKLATGLIKLGISAADRVAYLSLNTHKLLEGYYGVVQARAIVMPLNVRLSEAELAGILNHSGTRILMYEPDFSPMIEWLRSSCPAIEHWIDLDSSEYEHILEQGNPE